VGFADFWHPGESGAQQRFDTFLDDAVVNYQDDRNRPDIEGTSRLSPHLHFGEISPQQVVEKTHHMSNIDNRHGIVANAESFVREIGWREFAYHLLYHFPRTVDKPLHEHFNHFPWDDQYAANLHAWQLGRTGIPLVDAGMRELWHTGWMHNRVRMIVASFLTKNLLIPWQEGTQWFWDTLVDADLASNTLGWQWTAGCGADAAPYFRIFNPVTQAQKFDPGGRYIREWIPEIAALPDKYLAQPWAAPEALLSEHAIMLGRDYPEPVVDLKATRERALERYKTIKKA
jgi:deoxyribodipyrimidine photo-lyase